MRESGERERRVIKNVRSADVLLVALSVQSNVTV